MQPTLISGRAPGADASGPAVFPYGHVGEHSRWPTPSSATTCPHCDGTAVNAQGIDHCPGCDWTAGQ